MQLTKYFKMAAIMKKYGQPVTHEILEKEAERIEENTQRPEWLKKIKDMFQGDHNAYLRVFVLPVYVERSLYYDLFVKSKIIQKEPFERVQSFHQQVLSDGTSFVESAKKTEAKIIPLKVSYEDGVQWGDPKEKEPTQNVVDQTKAEQKKWMDKMARSRPSETAEVDRWVKDILTPLKPGMVSARLIDNETSWSVIKLVKKSGQKNTVYQLEAAVFPKLDWGAWIASELDSTE